MGVWECCESGAERAYLGGINRGKCIPRIQMRLLRLFPILRIAVRLSCGISRQIHLGDEGNTGKGEEAAIEGIIQRAQETTIAPSNKITKKHGGTPSPQTTRKKK